MPVHDWSRTFPGLFHDLRLGWVVSLAAWCNQGGLPSEYAAVIERPERCDRLEAELLDRCCAGADLRESDARCLRVDDHPPRVAFTDVMERDVYTDAADRIAVRHANGDRVVAYLEIVSPGNKHTHVAVERFFDKIDEALKHGCHLLIVDLFPPGRLDPRGLHAAYWERRTGEAHGVTPEKPLGLFAYEVHVFEERVVVPRAFVEPVAVGQTLPDMPLFLASNRYVDVPLEATYLEAWRGVPKKWRDVLEAGTTSS